MPRPQHADPLPISPPDIVQPTLSIPGDCTCTWVVTSPGPGMVCLSRLKALNRACPHRHKPLVST